jgi:hypothetical protein
LNYRRGRAGLAEIDVAAYFRDLERAPWPRRIRNEAKVASAVLLQRHQMDKLTGNRARSILALALASALDPPRTLRRLRRLYKESRPPAERLGA